MRIFNLFKLSFGRHYINITRNKRFTYCESCTRIHSKLCHKFCKKHNKYYWSIFAVQEGIEQSLKEIT